MKYLMMALGVFGADLGLKEHTNRSRLQGETEEVFGGKILLRNYHNPGSAFGFLKNQPKLNKGLSVFVLSGVTWNFLHSLFKRGGALRSLGLGLIVGGGANNCLERIQKGYVTDYLSFSSKNKKLERMVFNLSDFSIFVGMLLCGAAYLKSLIGKKE